MRFLPTLAFALLVAVPGLASENWFLPYEPDDHTLVLLHLDAPDRAEENAGLLKLTAKLRGDTKRGEGKFGGGVTLDGSDCGVGVSNDTRLRMAYNDPFTVEMWFRPQSASNASLWSLGTRYYLKLAPGTGAWTFGYRAASFPIRWYALAGPRISLNQWHHAALTHDETMTARIYLDGRLVGTVQHENEGDYEKGGGAQFGSHDGWTMYFNGALDEVRVSDVVREFAPLVSPTDLLPDEPIALKLDLSRLPAAVHSARVRVRDGLGKEILSKDLARNELASELLEASALPLAPLPDSGDAEAERRSRAQLSVDFLAQDGDSLASFSTPIRNVGAQVAGIASEVSRLKQAAADIARKPPLALRASQLELLASRIEELVDRRETALAHARAQAARRIAEAHDSGELDYRARVRQFVRTTDPPERTRITMSWNNPDTMEQAFTWAQRLGANEIVAFLTGDPKVVAASKQAGYRTAVLGNVPVHLGAHLKDHKDQAQVGWWVTLPVTAKTDSITIPIVSPTWGGGRICPLYDPREHWRVLDRTTDEFVPAAQWEVSEKYDEVSLSGATPGHVYVVYFICWAPGLGDVISPEFQQAGLDALDKALTRYDGALDTYWFDDLAYAYPGPTDYRAWDWEAYVYMARPERLAQFHKETGIEFDPRWLVNPPRTIDQPVRREYLQWTYWVQPQVNAWMKKASDVVRKHNMQSWLYWGDTHVGTEPFYGSLTTGGIDEVDKPASDPVTMRALADFPGNQLRRFRIDWVHSHKAVSPRFAAQLRDQWARVRRGLLMKPISGIYWVPFQQAAANHEAAVREDLVETMAEINDEFRLIADNLAGQAAWTHDLNVYVLNVWGKQYSWRPWGDRRLMPFTDLPVRTRFLSLLEVERDGIPDDADVLVCYGMPNTAQNGGHWWSNAGIAEAVRDFVRSGGGFLGMSAPSAHGPDGKQWPLAEMLGIVPEGTEAYTRQTFDASLLADVGGEEEVAQEGRSALIPTRRGADHWLARRGDTIPSFGSAVTVAAVQPSDVVFAATTDEGLLPGVVARRYGRGRCVWIAGHSASLEFDRLIRDAIFWSAKREPDSSRLEVVAGDGVYLYAYPDAGMIAVHNASRQTVEATCRLDSTIFPGATRGILRDIVTGDSTTLTNNAFTIHVPSQCTRLLRVQ